MSLIDEILNRKEFVEYPPVLLDIGASGSIHPKWRAVAKNSICIAFDADQREMSSVIKESSIFKKLYIYNRIVTESSMSEAEFNLTRSPYCSSFLKPDKESLKNWLFADLFDVQSSIKQKTIDLKTVLSETGIEKIDWFKVDSQGTDLRLFDSLDQETINRVLVAEFEPGILDSYIGEDKLWRIMEYMESKPFWMSDINIEGSQRVSRGIINSHFGPFDKRILPHILKISPGWGEVAYFNSFNDGESYLKKREFLLGWVFAIIQQQYGFALEIALKGEQRFPDPIFIKLENEALKRIKRARCNILSFIVKAIGSKISGIITRS